MNSSTRNNSASANHFWGSPLITSHISLSFDLILPPHSPDLTILLSKPLEREPLISPETRTWKNRYFIEKTRWHSLLLLRNITLKRKCTKDNFFLGIWCQNSEVKVPVLQLDILKLFRKWRLTFVVECSAVLASKIELVCYTEIKSSKQTLLSASPR